MLDFTAYSVHWQELFQDSTFSSSEVYKRSMCIVLVFSPYSSHRSLVPTVSAGTFRMRLEKSQLCAFSSDFTSRGGSVLLTRHKLSCVCGLIKPSLNQCSRPLAFARFSPSSLSPLSFSLLLSVPDRTCFVMRATIFSASKQPTSHLTNRSFRLVLPNLNPLNLRLSHDFLHRTLIVITKIYKRRCG